MHDREHKNIFNWLYIIHLCLNWFSGNVLHIQYNIYIYIGTNLIVDGDLYSQ